MPAIGNDALVVKLSQKSSTESFVSARLTTARTFFFWRQRNPYTFRLSDQDNVSGLGKNTANNSKGKTCI